MVSHTTVIFMYELLVLWETHRRCKECCVNDWTNLNLLAYMYTIMHLIEHGVDFDLKLLQGLWVVMNIITSIARGGSVSMCDYIKFINRGAIIKFHLIDLSHVKEWQSRLQWRERSYCSSLL